MAAGAERSVPGGSGGIWSAAASAAQMTALRIHKLAERPLRIPAILIEEHRNSNRPRRGRNRLPHWECGNASARPSLFPNPEEIPVRYRSQLLRLRPLRRRWLALGSKAARHHPVGSELAVSFLARCHDRIAHFEVM